MARVLHVAQPVDGGVARCVVDLAVSQAADGLHPAVACPPGSRLHRDASAAGLEVHDWPATRAPGPATPTEARRLREVIRTTRPDLVHLHSAKAGLAGRLVLRGRVPTVVQPHGWSYDAVSGPVQALTVAWERWATRWTTLLLCVSEAELAEGRARRTVPASAVVVQNGVDVQRFVPGDRAAARRVLGLDAGAPLAICVGRLNEQKGTRTAVDAWAAVRAAVPDARLHLVGDGPLGPELAARAAPGVSLVGPVLDVRPWYAAADVVVLPSAWGEAMALTPLEAMASGRSVVASDVRGVRESLPPGGGRVVPPGDATALAAALAERLGGRVDADAEGRRGRAHVVAEHDLRQTSRATTVACTALLRGG